MRRFGHAPGAMRWVWLLALLVPLLLAGCASWTHPTKPSTVFTEDAAACEIEAAQDPTTSGIFDADHYNAYLACLRTKGWELQQRPWPCSPGDGHCAPATGGGVWRKQDGQLPACRGAAG